VTVLYVTHDQAEAHMLGHRIAVMRAGLLQQFATRRELARRPASLFVARFTSFPGINFFTGTISADGQWITFQETGRSGDGFIPLRRRFPGGAIARAQALLGKKVILGVRAGELAVVGGPSQAEGIVEGTVEMLEPAGDELFVHINRGQERVIIKWTAEADPSPGEVVRARLDLRDPLFFDPVTEQAI